MPPGRPRHLTLIGSFHVELPAVGYSMQVLKSRTQSVLGKVQGLEELLSGTVLRQALSLEWTGLVPCPRAYFARW